MNSSIQLVRETRLGRSRLPLDLRLMLYDQVLQLKRNSFTYHEIISRIGEKYRVSLPKSTISGWVNGKNTPFNAGHAFVPRPCPELAYVIGTKTGDASLNTKARTYQYRIRLQAIDRDFVEAFNHAVAATLECPPHRLWKGDAAGEIHVEYGSYLLHHFLQNSLKDLAPFIESDRRCVAAFLKGFFDSEGSVAEDGSTTASNSDTELLAYVQYVLKKYFRIETTGPRLGTRKGTILTRRGKSYKRNADCFYIYLRRASLGRFYHEIRLTIARKRQRLEHALIIREHRDIQAETPGIKRAQGVGHSPTIVGWDSNPRVPCETQA